MYYHLASLLFNFLYDILVIELCYRKKAIDMKTYQENMSRDKSGKYEVISY